MAESSDDDGVEVLDLTMSVTKKYDANMSRLGGTSTSASSPPSYRPRSRVAGSRDTAGATGAALDSGDRSDEDFSLNQCRKPTREHPIRSLTAPVVAAASSDAGSRHAVAATATAAAAPVDRQRHDTRGNNDRATAVSSVQLSAKGKDRASDGREGGLTRKREELGGGGDDDGDEDDDDDGDDADFLVLTQEVSKFEVAGTLESEVVDLLSDSDDDEGERAGEESIRVVQATASFLHVRVLCMRCLSYFQVCSTLWLHRGTRCMHDTTINIKLSVVLQRGIIVWRIIRHPLSHYCTVL